MRAGMPALQSSFVSSNRTEDGRECNRRSNADEDYRQHRVPMPSIVIDVLHVGITYGGCRVGLAIAHDKLFIAGAMNVTLYFDAAVQSDGGARFRSHA